MFFLGSTLRSTLQGKKENCRHSRDLRYYDAAPQSGRSGEGCWGEQDWAFGYLALSASSANVTEMEVAAILAALGFLTGTFTYMALSRRIH
jgi:hypothetical protein